MRLGQLDLVLAEGDDLAPPFLRVIGPKFEISLLSEIALRKSALLPHEGPNRAQA
jgi:hypothetical protein